MEDKNRQIIQIHKKKAMTKSPMPAFFVLAYVFSWTCWILGSSKNAQAFLILGSFGPALSAVFLVTVYKGKPGIASLLKKMGDWRHSWHWYAFCLFSTFFLIRTAMVLLPLPQDRMALNANLPLQVLPLVFAYVFVFSVIGEEVGWRGYALPFLLKKYGALQASLILGFIWGLWHLPLFLLPGNFHQWIPFPWFLLQSIGLTFIMTYLYKKTNGSLLIASLFHAASNVTIGLMPVLPTADHPDLTLLKGSIVGLYLLILMLGWLEKEDAHYWLPRYKQIRKL